MDKTFDKLWDEACREGRMMDSETLDRLSRRIAEHFEPEPTALKNTKYDVAPTALSRHHFWYIDSIDLDAKKLIWKPRPCTDPEISMRLMKWLLERGLTLTITKAQSGEVFYVGTGAPCECAETLEEAIALAADRVIGEAK